MSNVLLDLQLHQAEAKHYRREAARIDREFPGPDGHSDLLRAFAGELDKVVSDFGRLAGPRTRLMLRIWAASRLPPRSGGWHRSDHPTRDHRAG